MLFDNLVIFFYSHPISPSLPHSLPLGLASSSPARSWTRSGSPAPRSSTSVKRPFGTFSSLPPSLPPSPLPSLPSSLPSPAFTPFLVPNHPNSIFTLLYNHSAVLILTPPPPSLPPSLSLSGGCEGHRAEIFASEVAKAHAALNDRRKPSADDLRLGTEGGREGGREGGESCRDFCLRERQGPRGTGRPSEALCG